MSETEWGYSIITEGGSQVGPHACSDRAAAEELVADFTEPEQEDRDWQPALWWRTPAAGPGPWHRWEPQAPATEGADDWTPQVLSDLLTLADVTVPPEAVAMWTADERQMAGEWAAAEHLSASDNPVRRLPKPVFLIRAQEICASPAQAQLAIEAWQARTAHSSWMMDPSAVARVAREAITGLVMLLKDRTDA